MKILKPLLIFIVIISWLFNYPPSLYKNLGGPRIWQNPPIPPEVKEAQAATSILYPNGESTAGNNQFTYVGDSTNYTNLQTNDGDTTYADSTIGNNYEHTVHLDDTTASGTINSVTVYLVLKYPTGSGAEDLGHMVVVGGTSYDLALLGTCAEFDSTSDYAAYSCQMNTSPATGSAWTWAEVDGMEAGIETDVMTSAQNITQVYAVVDYTPAESDVTAPASVSMSSYQLGGVGYNDYTFAAGELVAVVNAGASGWSLTVSSTNMTGAKNTITNANILLRTDGTLATEPTIITSSDSLTGVTETASGSYSLDSTRTIVTASVGNGIGTYNTRPTIRVNINNYGTYAETDTATLTFTVQ